MKIESLFFIFFPIVFTFNIDTKYPIIINNLADGSDSYFGATINLLKEDLSDISWIVIGSPRANSTAQNLVNVKEPGQIWRCSIGKKEETCEVVVVDPYDIKETTLHDRKNGSWLGGSIASRGKKFVSCANRWSNQFQHFLNDTYHYYMNGQCYWRPKSDITQAVVPQTVPTNYRLHPLRERTLQSVGEDSFYYIFGQAGFSSHLSEFGDLILGAPGIDQWKGGFVRYFDSPWTNEADESTFFKSTFVSNPRVDKLDEENCTYFGYAVTSGNFLKSKNSDPRSVQYVGGGPRANLLAGRVVVFEFPKEGAGDKAGLRQIQTIDGEQIGSYFGSVLCAVDVNKDGYDDLLIGAPNYNTKLRLRSTVGSSFEAGQDEIISTTFPGNGDEGSVFLYLSSGNLLTLSVSLVGGSKAWSHFGSSITSLGDLNKDGYNDVAIGSPYEDESRGAVYIFHGSKDGLGTEPAQVIKANAIDNTLRGFGYSLASDLDMNENGYNELSIGAFASNQVVILRSRPVVKLYAEVTTTMEKLPLNTTKFEFKSCISYSGFNAPPSLNIKVRLRTDIESIIIPRVYIQTGLTMTDTTVTYTEKVNLNLQFCSNYTAIVKKNLTITTKPIVFEQNVYLPEEEEHAVVLTRIHEIRIGTANNLQVRGAELKSFCHTCPVRVKTEPFTTKLALEVPCRSIDQCTSELVITASYVGIKEGGSFVIGSAPSVTLQVVVENLREPAFSPTISISWRKRHLVRIPPNCQRHPTEDMNFMSYQCYFGYVLPTNGVAAVDFEVDMRGIYAGHPDTENEYIFDIHANTTSELVSPANLTMILLLRAEADVWLTGSELEINYNPTNETQLPRKLASFQTALSGHTPVGKMLLYFEIPVNFTSNSKKLELLKITSYKATMDRITLQCKSDDDSLPSSEKNVVFDPSIDTEMIEPSLVQHDDRRNLKRRKREAEDLLSHNKIVINYANRKKPEISSNRKVLSLDCSKTTVDCVRLHCVVENINVGSNAIVEFSVTTSPKTMKRVMKTHKVESVHIHSYGTARIVGIDSQYIQPLGHKTDEAYAVTVIKPQVAEIPTWVYTVSIVGGLLALGAVILCCYAIGFFNRKKKEEGTDDMDQKQTHDNDDDDEKEYDETDGLRTQNRPGEDGDDSMYEDDDDRPPSPLETEQVTENISFSRR